MGVAAETSDFEVKVACIQRVAELGGWLGRTLVAQHALVPGDAGETLASLARSAEEAAPAAVGCGARRQTFLLIFGKDPTGSMSGHIPPLPPEFDLTILPASGRKGPRFIARCAGWRLIA